MKKQSKKPAKWSVESAAKRAAKESCDTVGLSHFGPSFQRVAEQIIRETVEEAAKRCEERAKYFRRYAEINRKAGARIAETIEANRRIAALDCATAIRAMLGRVER